jgi:hypothetical protein
MKKYIPELLIVAVLSLLIYQLNQSNTNQGQNNNSIRVQPLLIKSF